MYLHLQSLFSKYLENLENNPKAKLREISYPRATMATQCVGQKIVYRGAHLRQSTSSSPNFQLLQLNGQDISYGARMHAWKNKLILVLGLLKVAGTQ